VKITFSSELGYFIILPQSQSPIRPAVNLVHQIINRPHQPLNLAGQQRLIVIEFCVGNVLFNASIQLPIKIKECQLETKNMEF